MALERVFPGGPGTTLEAAKNWLRPRARKGAYCPCCKQYVRIYRRALGSQMARWLIWLVRTWEQADGGDCWVDVKKAPVRGGDYAKLVHWGLCENRVSDDKALRTSGLWRPTHKGIDFAQGRIKVPSHVELYDNAPLGFSHLQISITEALGEGFNYDELMTSQVTVAVPL